MFLLFDAKNSTLFYEEKFIENSSHKGELENRTCDHQHLELDTPLKSSNPIEY